MFEREVVRRMAIVCYGKLARYPAHAWTIGGVWVLCKWGVTQMGVSDLQSKG